MPKVRKRERVISSRVRPESSTRALGRVSVRGFRRVPKPAARIMAFIGGAMQGSGEWRVGGGEVLERGAKEYGETLRGHGGGAKKEKTKPKQSAASRRG